MIYQRHKRMKIALQCRGSSMFNFVRLMACTLIVLSLTVNPISQVHAANKADLRKQSLEAKKKQKQNAKYYKKNVKPIYDKQINKARKEREKAKVELRGSAQLLGKANAELKPFDKANQAAKKALDVQKIALDKAIEKASKNPTENNIKDRDSRQTRYDKAAKDYEAGPKKNFENKLKARSLARANYDKSRADYDSKIENIAILVKNKILEKQKARKVVDVNQVNRFASGKRVFDRPVVEPFNGNQKAKLVHSGQLLEKTDGEGNKFYVPDASPKLGRLLGGGANSIAYEDGANPSKVNKLVRITKADGTIDKDKESSITDQMAGRAILKKLQDVYAFNGKDSLFTIAQAYGPPVIMEAKAPNGTTQKFALSKEQNIASPVYDANGNVIGKATNAQERLQKRGTQQLTKQEELTINLVIRGLNQNGIAWTDHKLANLDIVKDPKSPTGHRVVFFDFDAFRPVQGADKKERYARARKVQRTFDQLDKGQMTQQLSNELVSKFDFTAFGGPGNVTVYMYTPGANKSRAEYHRYDARDAKTINETALLRTQGKMGDLIDPD